MSNTDEVDDNIEDLRVATDMYANKVLVINDLLFYVSNFNKGSSCAPENIKGVMSSFYDE